ncbi:MAG: hypothetical protein OEQ53_04870 [Saprospiraceae bacterium]|nr:hypothetical protein [Saprospiraceae bacterium]
MDYILIIGIIAVLALYTVLFLGKRQEQAESKKTGIMHTLFMVYLIPTPVILYNINSSKLGAALVIILFLPSMTGLFRFLIYQKNIF